MYGCAHYRTRHHRLRLAEAEIRQGTSIVAVQLRIQETHSIEGMYGERDRTYQYILQLNVPMQEALPVQEPDSLDHVQCYLHPRAKVYAHLQRCVEISRIARHEEEDDGAGTVGIVVIN